MARSRMHKRYARLRRNPGTAPKSNPPLFSELAEFVVPGFASFAGSRLATRIAATQVAKIRPNLSKHAAAGIAVGAFFAAWLLAHRWKWLSKYQTPVTVGAAIAALQSLIQLYVPRLGWMVSDASPELAAAPTQADQQLAVATQHRLRPVDDDPDDYVYNDMYDAGRLGKAPMQTPPTQAPNDDSMDLAIDDVVGSSGGTATGNLGVFAPN